MDRTASSWLFDPPAARSAVLARRRPGAHPVECVVSDAVWADVVRLLRWATADTSGDPDLAAGTWWRLAAGCADLLRRMPGLCAEICEPCAFEAVVDPAADLPGPERIGLVTGKVLALLLSPEPVPLRVLAAEVDALGEAAVHALAEQEAGTGVDRPHRPPSGRIEVRPCTRP